MWISVLISDAKTITHAAAQAQKAVDYLMGGDGHGGNGAE
jgi:antirestriction protein ArdC